MQIHQSAEDYLETILMLTQRMGRVRSIDVVNELGFTKASVSIGQPDPAGTGPRDRGAHL